MSLVRDLNTKRKKKEPGEMTLNEMLDMVAKPHLEYYKTMLDDSGVRDTNMPEMYKGKTVADLLEAEKESCIEDYLKYYPEIGIVVKMQKTYGEFTIHANYDTKASGKDLMFDLLAKKQSKFHISNPNIVFYSTKDYKKITHLESIVQGDDISAICKNFINVCLDSQYVIHHITDKGEGYATANIRELIINSGCSICIN